MNLELMDVIECQSVNGVRIGDSFEQANKKLGPSTSSPHRMSRRSRMFGVKYYNVMIYAKSLKVVEIEISFNTEDYWLVAPGEIENWNLDKWMDFALTNGWKIVYNFDAVNLVGSGVMIGLNNQGEVHVVVLFKKTENRH